MDFLIAQGNNGKLEFSAFAHEAIFNQWLSENKKLLIRKVKPTRSSQQNRYYWLYLGIIEKETGNPADDLHEFFKRKFLPPRFIRFRKEEMKIPGTTTGLSKADFSDYMDKICALTGVPLPNPEEAGFITNYGSY